MGRIDDEFACCLVVEVLTATNKIDYNSYHIGYFGYIATLNNQIMGKI